MSAHLDPRAHLPPCAFSDLDALAYLFSLTPRQGERAGHVHLEGCERCSLLDLCPGFADPTVKLFPGVDARPVRDERLRRRLTRIGTIEEQIEREVVEPSWGRDDKGSCVRESIVRTNFHCNQDCAFCFVSTHLPQPDTARVLAAIDEAVELDARVVLSGGEPTLRANLVDFVRRAKRSARPVQLQTNAIRCAQGSLVEDLERAGLDEAFVSLHGSTAQTCEALTRAPGTFRATLAGIDRIHGSSIALTINFVLCAGNLTDLAAVVRLCATRWPGAHLNVSMLAPATDAVPLDARLIPRHSEVAPILAQALTIARTLGVRVEGLASMCSLPLCLLPREALDRERVAPIPEGIDRGEFVHPAACTRCRLRPRCYGLRRRYVELHGEHEVTPVA